MNSVGIDAVRFFRESVFPLCRLAELPRFCSGKMSTTWKEEGGFSSK
jgi:hypothetical protein